MDLGIVSWLLVTLITLITITGIVLVWFAWDLHTTSDELNQELENSHEEK